MSPVIHRDVEQGSEGWFALRAGKFSASKAAVIMGGLDTSGLASYIQDLAWERVFGPVDSGYKSPAMLRGNEMEPESREWYAFDKGVELDIVGLVEHGSIANVCWSPDSLLPANRAIEAKNPLHKAWMEVKRTNKVPAEYRHQCRWAMWVGELDGLDFVCYHPKAGGLIVPCDITEPEKQQMAERVALLEPKVQAWVDILRSTKASA